MDINSVEGPWRDVLGHSNVKKFGTPLRSYAGYQFPVIAKGVETTMIPVVFPVTAAPLNQHHVGEHGVLFLIVALAFFICLGPRLILTSRRCPSCCKRRASRHMRLYFFITLLINVVLISLSIAVLPWVSVEGLFKAIIQLIHVVTVGGKAILMQAFTIVGLFLFWIFRRNIINLFGFEHQMVRWDLRDFLTGFTMHRFRVIEVSLLRCSDLPSVLTSRSLYARIICGFNEPQNTRVIEGCNSSMPINESFQCNYDPDDVTQKFSIVIRQSEVFGEALNQLAPAAGALAGGAMGAAFKVALPGGGMGTGAALGAVTGVSMANSMGTEVARVDFPAATINRIRAASKKKSWASRTMAIMATRSTTRWQEDSFVSVDLVPTGVCWLRIDDL
eukprot:CAMPEP_0194496604 /NCGR_PEP_ID=MMETSP0253-20130528/13821_1 /TAXON_ID=2966 /ORGANISM="Noctiluca scintillans" /LENGTH=388 /DNA_ID=CAMNT_0039338023 /DNA_START=1 /DNA_END=1167 /DNA_ORIENTATION=-